MTRIIPHAAILTFALLTTIAARAGPPYVTDDPEPTRTGGWENYIFVSGTNTSGGTTGQAGFELNYGAAENLQLTLTVPSDYVSVRGPRAAAGDIDASVKFRFLHPSGDGWLPDAAIFPALAIPTGAGIVSTRHASLFVPVWLEKDAGPWATFGGGGYDLNPGSGQKNFALVGWALTRALGPRLSVGLELYHQTSNTSGGAASTNIGIGTIYQMTKHWALMASGGPGLAPRTANTSFYLSLQFTN